MTDIVGEADASIEPVENGGAGFNTCEGADVNLMRRDAVGKERPYGLAVGGKVSGDIRIVGEEEWSASPS